MPLMHRVCSVDGCGGSHVGHGYCTRHYNEYIRRPKKPLRLHTCVACGERKPIAEMRHPNSSRGKTPSTCHSCREGRPSESWCDFHGVWHSRSAFTPRPDRPIGFDNVCVKATTIKHSMKLGNDPVVCVSCQDEIGTWNYRGGRRKSPTCRNCEEANPGHRWCLDCARWLPVSLFSRTGKGGKFVTVRCTPCRTAHNHGVTVAWILEKQGAKYPQCGSCGSVDNLKIDHDHACCPAANGCQNCVRGYLCHECNSAEGLLRSAERARLLANYMERHSIQAVRTA